MPSYSDVVLALIVGASLLIYFKESSTHGGENDKGSSPRRHRRRGIEGQKVFGKKDKAYWGTIVGQNGNHWKLNNGRFLRKDKQDRNWYVGS